MCVAAYGLILPPGVLGVPASRLPQRARVAAAALARRRARPARDPRRRRDDGRLDHAHGGGPRHRPVRRAGDRPGRRPRRLGADRRARTGRRARLLLDVLDRVRGGDGRLDRAGRVAVTYAEKVSAADVALAPELTADGRPTPRPRFRPAARPAACGSAGTTLTVLEAVAVLGDAAARRGARSTKDARRLGIADGARGLRAGQARGPGRDGGRRLGAGCAAGGRHRVGRATVGVSVLPRAAPPTRCCAACASGTRSPARSLDAVLDRSGLDTREAALATRLAYGTLQTLGTLDEALDRFLDEAVLDVEPRVRDALRVAAYELLVRAHARARRGPPGRRGGEGGAAAGRGPRERRPAPTAEAADDFPWGDPDTDDAALARLTAHPLWLVRHVDPPSSAARRPRGCCAPTTSRRRSTCGTTRSPARLEDAFRALGGTAPRPVALRAPGCLEARDAGAAVRGERRRVRARARHRRGGPARAQVAATRARSSRRRPRRRPRHEDRCSSRRSPCATAGRRELFAVDIHGFKSRSARRACGDASASRASRVLTGDATDVASIAGLAGVPDAADAVLLDAPCSGLGTLAAPPEKRWRVTPRGSGARSRRSAVAMLCAGGSSCPARRRCGVLDLHGRARRTSDVVAWFLGSGQGAAFRIRTSPGVRARGSGTGWHHRGGVLPVAARHRRPGRPFRRGR